jgi:site-specific DNA-methyltransferase (adenine-specific)
MGTSMNKIKLTLIQGDCLKVLPSIPSESVDLIITDPPYFIGKELTIHRSRNPKKYKYVGKDIEYNFIWDKFENEEEYNNFIEKCFTECFRILRNGGHLLSFFDIFKVSRLVEIARKNNAIPRQPLFWLKTNPVPVARKVSFMRSLELIFWATKGTYSRKVSTFNWQLGMSKDFIEAPIVSGNEKLDHPTQKPEKVVKWLMEYLSNEGDTVLDPFLGSGTTMKVARDLKRNCIGIEISPEYIEMTKKRLNWGNSLSSEIEWEFKVVE